MTTNLCDTVDRFQADVALVHEFVKGDKTVDVQGTDGTYPSLAKIAADAKVIVDLFTEEFQEVIDVNQSQLIAINNTLAATEESIAAALHLAQGVIGKTFPFTSTLELNVIHNTGTRHFASTITNIAGDTVYAPITIVNENEFLVKFTEEEAGFISVTFYLNA